MEELVDLLAAVIFTCSAGHASANNRLYEEGSFTPGYPPLLHGIPPSSTSVVTTDEDILAALPSMEVAMSHIYSRHLFSQNRLNSLGDFDRDYVYDPPAVAVVEQFRADLKAVSEEIKERNRSREPPYDTMLPENIANSISI